MNLLPILPLILPFFPSTTAAPVTTPFNLVTFSPNTAHDNLYLSTQSTGPLNSNPVFRDPANAATFSLANTTVHYEAPNKAPWALALVNGDVVQGNVEVSVSPSAASAVSTGFEIAEDGRLGVDSSRWGGWLVCPGQGTSLLELFYQDTTAGSVVPNGCDQVQLNAVFKSS
ncbi:uncharacterized protein N7458_000875 [Penicillium daleae]|uniref:DUF7907 domain-containing protein n=1 Tax=Penicillium daleae TaxID=63821 RepID=A0AAD6CJN7_9EURO|nr:uncharacterized protein N7458_000875 [Penicillium daleae]KAJ5465189.1 hypothetical protein N7458_000875 [Penicillium daleae]